MKNYDYIVDHCSTTGKEFTQCCMQLLWFAYVVCLHACVHMTLLAKNCQHIIAAPATQSISLFLHLCSDLSSVSDVDLNDNSLA